jgi:hypothetical protein
MVARRSRPQDDPVALLDRIAREVREGTRPIDPELAEALRHEIQRRPEVPLPAIPEWHRALIREALEEGDEGSLNPEQWRAELARIRERATRDPRPRRRRK